MGTNESFQMANVFPVTVRLMFSNLLNYFCAAPYPIKREHLWPGAAGVLNSVLPCHTQYKTMLLVYKTGPDQSLLSVP